MTRGPRRHLAIGLTVALAAIAAPAYGADQDAQPHAQPSPHPQGTPVARDRDPVSGAPEVGIGRATGAVKSSGDEGGTAAGMPANGPNAH